MKQIKGWGIPTVGALSLSLGLWAVIFFGWIQLTEIFVGIENPWSVLLNKDEK